MAVRYLKSYGFVLDLMAVLPLEVFALVWSNSEEQWSYFALLRVNRLLKLWKVCKYMQIHTVYDSCTVCTHCMYMIITACCMPMLLLGSYICMHVRI